MGSIRKYQLESAASRSCSIEGVWFVMFLYLCRMFKRGYYSVRAGGFQTPQEGTNLLSRFWKNEGWRSIEQATVVFSLWKQVWRQLWLHGSHLLIKSVLFAQDSWHCRLLYLEEGALLCICCSNKWQTFPKVGIILFLVWGESLKPSRTVSWMKFRYKLI